MDLVKQLLPLLSYHVAGGRPTIEGEVVLVGISDLLIGLLHSVCHLGLFTLVSKVALGVNVGVDLIQLSKHRSVESLEVLRKGAQLGILPQKIPLTGPLIVFFFDREAV